jgi:erythromycin esterase-like protein
MVSTTYEVAIRRVARPLQSAADLNPLIERIGDARIVMLGEASHGTSDYYLWRMRLSQRLIEEKGFSFIAVEGDWPDCYRVNRYIKGYPDAGEDALDVLHDFRRWPTWMWANWEVVALAEWLRTYNDIQPAERKVGFYGLDVYSLWESLAEVSAYLERTDPEAAKAARQAFLCFQPYHEDAQSYAWATRVVPMSCEKDVINLLVEARKQAAIPHPGDGEEAFNAEQNALVTVGAERYYRAMIQSGPDSWNIRDQHMTETLERLLNHLGSTSKAIVWEHNTHIGDARATDMAGAGMVNIGQLARERRSADGVVLVGCGSYRGTVTAGQEWGAPMERMTVPEAREGSWEELLHQTIGSDALLIFSDQGEDELFRRSRSHRAIGVVYQPQYERMGNYVSTSLSRRYDAFLYLDESVALHPLHITPEASLEPPETYPFAV